MRSLRHTDPRSSRSAGFRATARSPPGVCNRHQPVAEPLLVFFPSTAPDNAVARLRHERREFGDIHGFSPQRCPRSVEEATTREFSAAVATCIAELGPRHREILERRILQSCTYDEIAAALGISVGTVKAALPVRVKPACAPGDHCPEFAPVLRRSRGSTPCEPPDGRGEPDDKAQSTEPKARTGSASEPHSHNQTRSRSPVHLLPWMGVCCALPPQLRFRFRAGRLLRNRRA